MKTTLIILITLLSIAVILTACTNKSHTTTHIVGLWDITDKSIPRPDAKEITKFYGFEKDKWNGGSFRFSAITQVSLNPSEYQDVRGANQLLSNEFKREEEIKLFEKGVADIIDRAEQAKTGQNNSSIYLPIASELNQLAKSEADSRKILLIYSDLMENTEQFSFYRKKDLSLLVTSPESLAKQLENIQPLDELSGIEVYFIYQPSDSKSDTLFQLVSGFYKKLLEQKGAKVFISANLNN